MVRSCDITDSYPFFFWPLKDYLHNVLHFLTQILSLNVTNWETMQESCLTMTQVHAEISQPFLNEWNVKIPICPHILLRILPWSHSGFLPERIIPWSKLTHVVYTHVKNLFMLLHNWSFNIRSYENIWVPLDHSTSNSYKLRRKLLLQCFPFTSRSLLEESARNVAAIESMGCRPESLGRVYVTNTETWFFCTTTRFQHSAKPSTDPGCCSTTFSFMRQLYHVCLTIGQGTDLFKFEEAACIKMPKFVLKNKFSNPCHQPKSSAFKFTKFVHSKISRLTSQKWKVEKFLLERILLPEKWLQNIS